VNQQLQGIIEDYTKKAYTAADAADRPDLLLAANVESRHLLIELKRPSIAVGRDAENQTNKYADTLTGKLGIGLEILIIGGEVDSKLQHACTGTVLLKAEGLAARRYWAAQVRQSALEMRATSD
jgi:hypothetical protein